MRDGFGSVDGDDIESKTFEIVSAGLHIFTSVQTPLFGDSYNPNTVVSRSAMKRYSTKTVDNSQKTSS